ncbi:MAG: NGG1p interacting factor NIF3, partial [Candidatus Buchananbacteria bacterium]
MTLKEIYALALEMGIGADLRGESRVRKNLAKVQEKFDKMNAEQKEEFDVERLSNPYSDTRILFDNGRPVVKVLVGIDIDPQEIIMAKQLGYDTVIAHHPEGEALAALGDVMHLQAEVLAQYGVPINVAQAITKERISEVTRSVSPANHERTVDAARLLDINLICIHTPCDNLAADFLNKIITTTEIETVG